MSINALFTSIPTNSLLDSPTMACLRFSVDALVLHVWPCVARHVIHDTEEAGLHQREAILSRLIQVTP